MAIKQHSSLTGVDLHATKDDSVGPAQASAGLGRYVPRSAGAYDFTEANFTHDGAWHTDGLNLSAIVPAGAIAVHLVLYILGTTAGKVFALQKNAVDTLNYTWNIIQGATAFNVDAIVAVDPDRLMDYLSSLTGTDGTTRLSRLAVLGWFI